MTGEEMIAAAEDWVYDGQEISEPDDWQQEAEYYRDRYFAMQKREDILIGLLRNLTKEFPAGTENTALEAATNWLKENDDIPF